MALADTETVICLNREDMASGYFSIWTSERPIFDRLCRRIGGRDKLLECKVGIRAGKEGSWDCQVPIAYFNRATFAIGRRRASNLTPEQRKAVGDRLKPTRKARNAQASNGFSASDSKNDLEGRPDGRKLILPCCYDDAGQARAGVVRPAGLAPASFWPYQTPT
jgi:hypothetical protein